MLTYADLRALRQPADRRAPTRQFDLHLTGNMECYIWGFDGKNYSDAEPIRFVYGERLRMNMINTGNAAAATTACCAPTR